ncbi:DUF4440 domain-containing protein [Streptomyces sp. TS71-3]|uniref:nuclear transport factor 2 family protein n=1 Tax=Streptomyces sp. TS71-3 TaxID=2733862 RepID=UPI001B06C06B|nr:nuclear transport factor 2 family protein [Streptomyces sp. TS71-3]GHJ38949.1 hypothetical protein Sm713_45580 [Streptomyces sp. TS71-3]
MDDGELIIEREIALQRPQVRADRAAVLALLTPDFVEVDRTGRAWDAESVATALAAQQGYVQPQATDFALARLAPGVCLLTYRDEATMHSSVWVRSEDGQWLLRFHQQTSRAS